MILALVGEVGELAELFQWPSAPGARRLAEHEPLKTWVGEEMANVLLCLVRPADILNMHLAATAQAIMDDSKRRFPPDQLAGTAPEGRTALVMTTSPMRSPPGHRKKQLERWST